jgi:hypothetical protein
MQSNSIITGGADHRYPRAGLDRKLGRAGRRLSSHQESQQAGERGAAEQQQPVAGVETKDPAFGGHTCDHDFLE